MSKSNEKMSKFKGNVIITISRSYGSGGRRVGKKVADELGIPFYDKELLELAVRDGRVSLNDLHAFDEKSVKVDQLLYSMIVNPYVRHGMEPLGVVAQDVLTNVIKTVAKEGSCVIVGRHADKILRNQHDILSVFVSAPLEKRIARVATRDGLSEKDSEKTIQKADKSRQAFYNSYGEGEWGDAANYNLCIDSSDLGVDNAAAMILHYLRLKGKIV